MKPAAGSPCATDFSSHAKAESRSPRPLDTCIRKIGWISWSGYPAVSSARIFSASGLRPAMPYAHPSQLS